MVVGTRKHNARDGYFETSNLNWDQFSRGQSGNSFKRKGCKEVIATSFYEPKYKLNDILPKSIPPVVKDIGIQILKGLL